MQVSARSLAKNFPATLDLIADVALHPAFPPEEIERQRGQRLASLVQQRDNPATVAATVMAAALYGAQHPYGYHRARDRSRHQGDDARRPAGLLEAELRAEQRRADRRRQHHRWPS